MDWLNHKQDEIISVFNGSYQLELINVSLNELILIWVGYYWSRLVNISLNGLNIKRYQLILLRNVQYGLKYQMSLTNMNPHLVWIILTNYWWRMTKTEFALVSDSIGQYQLNIGYFQWGGDKLNIVFICSKMRCFHQDNSVEYCER